MSELTAHASGSPDDDVRAERAFRRKLTNYVRRVQRLSPSRHEKEALRQYVAQYAGIDPATLAPPAELPPPQQQPTPQEQQLQQLPQQQPQRQPPQPQPSQPQQLQEAEGEGVPRGDMVRQPCRAATSTLP